MLWKHYDFTTGLNETRRQRYAAGDFPTQSRGESGLGIWTQANRSIANQDIVVWYTVGHTHIPRTEQWPVMPTARFGYKLMPNNFFDRNPAINLPDEE